MKCKECNGTGEVEPPTKLDAATGKAKEVAAKALDFFKPVGNVFSRSAKKVGSAVEDGYDKAKMAVAVSAAKKITKIVAIGMTGFIAVWIVKEWLKDEVKQINS